MEKEINGKTKFRLIGVGAAQITNDENADPQDLVDGEHNKAKAMEKAMDNVEEKYGSGAIELGITFKNKTKNNKKRK